MACNWASFAAFRACETQWRVVATMAGLVWIGLDYAACHILLQRQSRRRRPGVVAPRIFDDLRAMEEAALPVLNTVGD